MKIFALLFVAAMFAVGGCSQGGSDSKSITTVAKTPDGTEVVTSSQ